jgi:hypothetical protein
MPEPRAGDRLVFLPYRYRYLVIKLYQKLLLEIFWPFKGRGQIFFGC